MVIRALTEDDRGALEGFTCARLGEPWTEEVEEEIREELPNQLASGAVSTVGLFDEDRSLRGVAAWRMRKLGERIDCRGDIVAVAIASQGKGYGRQLKQAMIDAAKTAGAVTLVSVVHSENRAMLHLNDEFGATVDCRDEEEPRCYCYIALMS